MRSRRAAALLGLAMLLLPGAFSGCGDGKAGSDTAQTLLKDTFGPGHPIKSGRFSLSLNVTGSGAGLGDPVALELKGPFVSSGPQTLPRFALQLRLGNETNQHTVPYVYLRGRFIGGYNALAEVERLGQLEQALLSAEARAALPAHERAVEIVARPNTDEVAPAETDPTEAD